MITCNQSTFAAYKVICLDITSLGKRKQDGAKWLLWDRAFVVPLIDDNNLLTVLLTHQLIISSSFVIHVFLRNSTRVSPIRIGALCVCVTVRSASSSQAPLPTPFSLFNNLCAFVRNNVLDTGVRRRQWKIWGSSWSSCRVCQEPKSISINSAGIYYISAIPEGPLRVPPNW